MAQGLCAFLLLLGGSKGCGEGSGSMASAGPGFRSVLFCLKIKKSFLFNSRKINSDLSFCSKSL